MAALRLYHQNFEPSEYLKQPESLISVSVVCAETDERAKGVARPLELTLLRFDPAKWVAFRRSKRPRLAILDRRTPDHRNE